MNRREKILAVAVGLFVGLFVIYMIVNSLVLSDMRRLGEQEAKLEKAIETQERQFRSYQSRADRLDGLMERTFGTEENVASERVRQRLDRLLKVSGLELSVNPIIGAKVQGQYKEVGWALSAKGKIKQLLDFLYLLDEEPYLHRVDKLSLTPRHRSGQMEMKLRYLTLVPAEQKGRQYPPGEVAQSGNPEKLDTQQRKLYDVIAMRDPFRPYVKYVAPPPPKPKPKKPKKPRPSKPRTPPKPRPKPDPIKVVSLTTWAGQQEVHLRNLKTGKIQVLKPGEAFPGGKIVMIDYRPLPLAGKPETISSSRLIFRKGNAYWAVELGQELTKERRIPTPQLPEELRSK